MDERGEATGSSRDSDGAVRGREVLRRGWRVNGRQRNQRRNADSEEEFLKTGDPAHHPHESKDAGKKGRGVG